MIGSASALANGLTSSCTAPCCATRMMRADRGLPHVGHVDLAERDHGAREHRLTEAIERRAHDPALQPLQVHHHVGHWLEPMTVRARDTA